MTFLASWRKANDHKELDTLNGFLVQHDPSWIYFPLLNVKRSARGKYLPEVNSLDDLSRITLPGPILTGV